MYTICMYMCADRHRQTGVELLLSAKAFRGYRSRRVT